MQDITHPAPFDDNEWLTLPQAALKFKRADRTIEAARQDLIRLLQAAEFMDLRLIADTLSDPNGKRALIPIRNIRQWHAAKINWVTGGVDAGSLIGREFGGSYADSQELIPLIRESDVDHYLGSRPQASTAVPVGPALREPKPRMIINPSVKPSGISEPAWESWLDACRMKPRFWEEYGGVSSAARLVARMPGRPARQVDTIRRHLTRIKTALDL